MISPVTAVTIQKRGEGLPRKYTFRDGHFGRTIDNAPVNTRAWVMQERYMSPRALHFGAQQVFWEYRDKIASELNPDGLSVGPGRRFKSQFVDMRDQHANKGGWEDIFGPMGDFAPSCHHHDERDDFISLVRNYSSCRLTFPTDKIIAFSAIMKQICGFWHHEPVAGMRSRCLENDLLWSASQDNEPSQYETYAAPSWSWASVKGKVDYPPVPFSSSLIRVEDYKLEYVTKDPTGAVRGGWLRLSGALRKVKLLRGDVNAPRAGSWSLTFDGAEIEWSNPKTPWVVKLDAPFDRFDDEN
ncbi:hypothetical protein LRP88_14362 [Fusarium phalaenopsidis]|nr:HET domain-containing protein [Fusarium sp. Ph1]